MTDKKAIYKLSPQSESLTIQIIRDRIKLGFELQELDHDLSDDEILKYNDCLMIAPDYQREYRSTAQDESSLVESILLGIPIPPVFLASNKYKRVQVLNVVDGQHRLRAFFRFIENKFLLKGLKILKDLEGDSFKKLDITEKASFQSGKIDTITFRDFPGKEFELEIFSRYNKGTKPLTAQEIRHAVYDSQTNTYINKFAKDLVNNKENPLSKIYGVSKDRFQKKSLHESLFVILYILEHGISLNLLKSPQYAENYMSEKSELERKLSYSDDSDFINTKNRFSLFNEFLQSLISENLEYPFSREIYGFSRRKSKFQISIAMIIAGIFKKLQKNGIERQTILSPEFIEKYKSKIKILLSNSHLENSEYKASSTNPKELIKVVEKYSIE